MKPKAQQLDGIRWDAGSHAIGYQTTARGVIGKPTGKALEHVVNYVRKHGPTKPMEYVRASGMSFRGAMVRLICAEESGQLKRSGEGYDLVFEVVEVERAD